MLISVEERLQKAREHMKAWNMQHPERGEKPYRLVNVETGQEMDFRNSTEAAKHFELNKKTGLSHYLKTGHLVKGKWRVEEL